MKKRIFFLILTTGMFTPLLPAQDWPRTDPKRTRLLLENDRVRVYEGEIEPGGVTPVHSHPDYLAYAFTDAHLKITMPDGAAKEINIRAGTASWNDPETHRIENIGEAPFRVLYLELKPEPKAPGSVSAILVGAPAELNWEPAPRGFPEGIEIARLDGDPNEPGPFTLRMRFPAGLELPPHRHRANERLTVLSGTLSLGFTERGEPTKTTAYGPGSYLFIPANQAHYGRAEEETVVQIHGSGPWRVLFLQRQQGKERSGGGSY